MDIPTQIFNRACAGKIAVYPETEIWLLATAINSTLLLAHDADDPEDRAEFESIAASMQIKLQQTLRQN